MTPRKEDAGQGRPRAFVWNIIFNILRNEGMNETAATSLTDRLFLAIAHPQPNSKITRVRQRHLVGPSQAIVEEVRVGLPSTTLINPPEQ